MPHEMFVALHGGHQPTQYIELGNTDIPQVCAYASTADRHAKVLLVPRVREVDKSNFAPSTISHAGGRKAAYYVKLMKIWKFLLLKLLCRLTRHRVHRYGSF